MRDRASRRWSRRGDRGGAGRHKAAEIEAWIGRIAGLYNVLPLDGVGFRAWARLMHRKPDDLVTDALIAATASVHDLVVVTRNVRDFRRFGSATLNPWRPGSG